MFDDVLKELKKLEKGIQVPVQIPLDEKGCMDRRCPSDKCGTLFKVLFEDWRDKVRDEVVYCPACRREAPSTEWNTEEQTKYLKSVGKRHMVECVQRAMARDARNSSARQPKGCFVSLSLSFKPGQLPVMVSIEAADALRQDFTCESCGCRYSSVGAAFFCPACGHNSAISTFNTAVETVIAAVEGLPTLHQSLGALGDQDAAANVCRDILESRLEKLVSSFQRFAEATYTLLPEPKAPAKKNVFQRLQDSSDLWRAVGGKGYDEVLAPNEMADLVRLFQQRHLLAHREGMVDEEYIKKSRDTSYAAGQRIVVRSEAVRRLAALLRKLAAALPGVPPPALPESSPVKEAHGLNLTSHEVELLHAASTDGNLYLLARDRCGQWVQAGNRDFKDDGKPATAARYRDALDSLTRKEFVKHEGGQLWTVTGKGWDVGEKLAENGTS